MSPYLWLENKITGNTIQWPHWNYKSCVCSLIMRIYGSQKKINWNETLLK